MARQGTSGDATAVTALPRSRLLKHTDLNTQRTIGLSSYNSMQHQQQPQQWTLDQMRRSSNRTLVGGAPSLEDEATISGAPHSVLRRAIPVADLVQMQLDASSQVAADFRRQAELTKSLEVFLKGLRHTLQDLEGLHKTVNVAVLTFFSGTPYEPLLLPLTQYCDNFRKLLVDLSPNLENAIYGGTELLRRSQRAGLLLRQRDEAAREVAHYTQKLSVLKQKANPSSRATARIVRNEHKLEKALGVFSEKEQALKVQADAFVANRFMLAASVVSKATRD
ncbi:hypothetical protein Esti_006556 [Eimeria stiedai]